MKIYYNNNLKNNSRQLRNKSTLPEILLWKKISGKKVRGYQFSRQKIILNYIVDFYCSKLKLVIEVDGESHIDKWNEIDIPRQKQLEKLGLKVLRFNNNDVLHNLECVVSKVEETISQIEANNNVRTTPCPLC